MRTYPQLTPAQQKTAQDRCLDLLLQSILDGITHFPGGHITGACEFCEDEQVALVATLKADPDQYVCRQCHEDPRIPTVGLMSDLQTRIDAAIQKADDMQTPWFAHEYILDACRPELAAIAKQRAEGGLYPEPGEDVIEGVIQ